MVTHETFMQRCLELAAHGLGHVDPNPMVGAVIVHDEKIIAEGWHQRFGEAHAEVNAIRAAVEKGLAEVLRESTLYVNLEPCSHHGKTPPCADLILEMGIPRVVVSNLDPYEKVAGKGLQRLRSHGVDVTTGVLEQEGRFLNRRFFTYHEQKRAYIILKWAQTMDGFLDHFRVADDARPPLRITGERSNVLTHRWRSEEKAILVGKNTVLLDNPRLTTRLWEGRNPLRLIIDPRLELSRDLHVFADGNATWVYNALREYCEGETCYLRIDDPDSLCQEIAAHLYHNDVQSVIVEGGGDTLQRFIDAGLWDEARIFIGPERIGSGVPCPTISGYPASQEFLDHDVLQYFYRT